VSWLASSTAVAEESGAAIGSHSSGTLKVLRRSRGRLTSVPKATVAGSARGSTAGAAMDSSLS
jgi:hypothetical protein